MFFKNKNILHGFSFVVQSDILSFLILRNKRKSNNITIMAIPFFLEA